MANRDQGPGRGGIRPQGQRYYLYDNELSRPNFQPRGPYMGRRPQRPSFDNHEYHGIYPTKRYLEPDTTRFFDPEKIRRESVYSRPPDEYHTRSRDRDREDRYSRREREGNSKSRSRSRSRRRSRDRGSESRSSRYHDTDRDRYEWDRHRRKSGSSIEDTRGRSRSPQPHSSHSYPRRHSDEGSRRKSPPPRDEHADEFDLNIEMHPLMHYIEDKPRLLREAFSI